MITFLIGDGVMRWQEGVETSLIFLGIGAVVAWRNGRINFTHLAELFVALFMARVAVSYWRFHEPLREGCWPLLWTASAYLGTGLACWLDPEYPDGPTGLQPPTK